MMKRVMLIGILCLLITTIGCAFKVKYSPVEPLNYGPRLAKPITLALITFEDKRDIVTLTGRRISIEGGKPKLKRLISAAGYLDQEISNLVTNAIQEEFQKAGFNVTKIETVKIKDAASAKKIARETKADYILSGIIEVFYVDFRGTFMILGTQYGTIKRQAKLEAILYNGKTGKVIWSDTFEEFPVIHRRPNTAIASETKELINRDLPKVIEKMIRQVKKSIRK